MTRRAAQLLPPLIRRLGDARPTSPVPVQRLEPAFLTAKRRRLNLDTQGSVVEAKAFLDHTIARHPADLQLQVRCTILHAETRDPNILGAICDLYPALGDKRPALRRHMLAQLDEEALTR